MDHGAMTASREEDREEEPFEAEMEHYCTGCRERCYPTTQYNGEPLCEFCGTPVKSIDSLADEGD